MFTGLVEAVGTLESRSGGRLVILAAFSADLAIGESIAIAGVCLTVVSRTATTFTVDVSPTTLGLTTAGKWKRGTRVNLERALALGERLGGHIVTGHVDGVGRLAAREALGNSTKLWFEMPSDLARASLPLGSISIDGVSLTLNEVEMDRCSVTIIPETARKTTLGDLAVGTPVNLETDVIGKYVKRLLGPHLAAVASQNDPGAEGLTWAKLAESGFLTV
ncbi:MAG: riboflavin synthase [Candidatus Sericytochromatia bacterium]|nr:riboflavin synthase [Candidatus Tanganyikabacteria bacterium]